jgi:hypothetical protein
MGTRLGGGFLVVAALCGVAPAAPGSEDLTAAERAGLALLHRHAVKLFIDRGGFGFSRVEPPLTDIVGPPQSQAEAPADPPPAADDPLAARPDKGRKDAHFPFAKAVEAARYVPPVGTRAWVPKEIRLVGLVKHPDPVVYLTGGGMRRGKADVKTRRPDAFEAKALEVIRGGGELVQAEKRGDTLRAVSGIFAGRQCLTCHERPWEMLGAFSYRLALEAGQGKGAADGVGRPVLP